MSGYKGELKLDYPLSRVHFPNHILHSIRLRNHGSPFQMDSLLLTPRFLLIIEAKNTPGKIYFSTQNDKMERELDGEISKYDNPVTQVEEQKYQLEHWCSNRNLPPIPIEHLVVFTNKNVDLQLNDFPSRDRGVELFSLNKKIRELSSQYSHSLTSMHGLKSIGHQIAHSHSPKKVDLIKELGLSKNEIKKGVICPSCNYLHMYYQKRKWSCPRCSYRSASAYIETLKDYYILESDKINTSTFQKITKLTARHHAYYYLNKLNLSVIGGGRSQKYKLEFKGEDFNYLIAPSHSLP
ncbi:nuclease-related domain-containing protein [Halalkalibacillus sediminis]|nr:nuclease-related domain-containing protein [Halalkalibacillus sediminis]